MSAPRDTQVSYDRVAEEYTARIGDELAHKPFDRETLARFVTLAAETPGPDGRAVICDLGCGPGHVGRYLHELGAEVVGVDLSPGMLEQARRLNPEIEFMQGDMRKLNVPDGVWSGIAAFYSIIHVQREEVVSVLGELRRVLVPGGRLLLAFHLGSELVHRDDLWEQPVNLDFLFFGREEMEAYLQEAGFEVEESREREPYVEFEHPSRRGYILARNGDGE